MKKILAISIFLAATAVAAAAQSPENPWAYQFQLGYNTSTKNLDNGWLGRTGVSYGFSEAFRLNVDLGYWEGKMKHSGQKDHLWTFMVSPEYVYKLSDSDQVYGLLGVGAVRNDSKTLTFGGIPVHVEGTTKLAEQAAIGYRHFFTKAFGLTAQATYTHFKLYGDNLNPVDASVGLVYRF